MKKSQASKTGEKSGSKSYSEIGSELSGSNLLGTAMCQGRGWAKVGTIALGKSYDEVLQGCINDCSFLAALSAVAWGYSAKLTSNYPTYTFYDITAINPNGTPKVTPGQSYTLTNDNVPTDGSSPAKPLHARKPSTGDTWALIYEKAYAVFKDPNHNTSQPDYSKIDGGNGWKALVNITGLTNGIENSANRTAAQILADLNLSTSSSQKITNRAAVAWTNSSGMPDVSLYASHTYSILGSYISGGNTYLVLRNPYGNQTGGQIVNPEPSTGVTRPHVNWLSTGIWLDTITDGIFAYNINDFRQYFSKYGVAV